MSVSVRDSEPGSSDVQPTSESTAETMTINLAVKFGFIVLNGESETRDPRQNLWQILAEFPKSQLVTTPELWSRALHLDKTAAARKNPSIHPFCGAGQCEHGDEEHSD